MSKTHERRMVVEGEDDKFAIIQLMAHHTDWPDGKSNSPVLLEAAGSVDAILEEGFVSAKVKESGTRVLGVVLDADVDFDGRWQRIRQICGELFKHVPEQAPSNGLILQDSADGPRLGIWIMPDNRGHGMLEDFLQHLVHDRPPLDYAKAVVVEAREKGAPYKTAHKAKAEIHTWLAWQDPPGQALGRAVTSFTLDPKAQSADQFVAWFLQLYDLPRLPSSTTAA